MDATILAVIKTNQSRRLMPEEIAAVNAYVTDGKTSDLIQLGTEVGSNAINYHKSKAKLSDQTTSSGGICGRRRPTWRLPNGIDWTSAR